MGYIRLAAALVIWLFSAIIAIPVVLFSSIVVPILSAVFFPVFLALGWAYGGLSRGLFRRRVAKVLLIDDSAESALAIREMVGNAVSIEHVDSSFREMGSMLKKRPYDYLFVKWTRRYLSGEKILDYLDDLGSPEIRVPPVIFVRGRGESPFRVQRAHGVPVLGCIDLDWHTAADEMREILNAA